MEEEVGQIRRKMNAGVATTAKKRRERERESEGSGGWKTYLSLKVNRRSRAAPRPEMRLAKHNLRSGKASPFCSLWCVRNNWKCPRGLEGLCAPLSSSKLHFAAGHPLSRPNRVIIVEGAQWSRERTQSRETRV